MGGRVSRGCWWVAMLLGACQGNTGGIGSSGANTLSVPDDTGDSLTEGTTGTDEADTTSVGTGVDPSAAETSPGPGDGTTDEPGATSGGSAAMLSISDGPTFDFGDVTAGGQLSHLFVVTNAGDAAASGLSAVVAAPFALGGASDCGASLGAGEACTLEVTFSPGELGLHAGALTVSHDAGPEAVVALEGGASGETDNLIANAGGEEPGEPPPGWSVVEGDWIAGALAQEVSVPFGSGYLYADTGASNVDLELRQDVDVSAWALTVDEGALRVSFSGHATGYWNGNGDQHRIRVHYLDAGGSTLALWNTDYLAGTEWQEHADSRTAPAGTRTVRVELNCRKNSGSWCNAYFDALDLRAAYP